MTCRAESSCHPHLGTIEIHEVWSWGIGQNWLTITAEGTLSEGYVQGCYFKVIQITVFPVLYFFVRSLWFGFYIFCTSSAIGGEQEVFHSCPALAEL